jgi:hypothetical protein
MSELPSPVSESTAAEYQRIEGTARSAKAVAAITLGEIVGFVTSSGYAQIPGGTSGGSAIVQGVALYTQTSGNRATVIRGKVRSRWDGVANAKLGDPIAVSTTRSGWWETSQSTSGELVVGKYIDTIVGTTAAANSGTLLLVEII